MLKVATSVFSVAAIVCLAIVLIVMFNTNVEQGRNVARWFLPVWIIQLILVALSSKPSSSDDGPVA